MRIAGIFNGLGVETEEDATQAGIFADQQRLDAAVLEEFDGHALERAPVVGDLRRRPAPVADHVCKDCPVAVDAPNCSSVLEHIRDAQSQLVVIGNRLAQFVKGGGVRHQLVAITPQRTQVKIKLALDIGEALVVGDASLLPTRVVVSAPRFKPNSATVDFWDRWCDAEPVEGTEDAVLSWRRQSNY